jgi:hypothetical protein
MDFDERSTVNVSSIRKKRNHQRIDAKLTILTDISRQTVTGKNLHYE